MKPKIFGKKSFWTKKSLKPCQIFYSLEIWHGSPESTFRTKSTTKVTKNTPFSNCLCKNTHEAENFRQKFFDEKKHKALPNFLRKNDKPSQAKLEDIRNQSKKFRQMSLNLQKHRRNRKLRLGFEPIGSKATLSCN